jgi:EAL domain-containing protein (putative c-di-GMP-specific phosphodiesterase class I)
MGYSSIDYLRRYPVDALKIDRSFVMHMEERPQDIRMVRLMMDIARELSINVIAEGIETEHQFRILQEMGCQEGQGYFFAKPMKAEDFISWQDAHQRAG